VSDRSVTLNTTTIIVVAAWKLPALDQLRSNSSSLRAVLWHRLMEKLLDDCAFPSKSERFSVFLERLKMAPLVATENEAYLQLYDTLNAVEDELTPIPYDLENSLTDGRMYPPFEDNKHSVAGHVRVQRYRSRGHNTFIGANGSIEIQLAQDGACLLSKHGQDGRGVWDS
jgi:hypothetical protein